MSVRVYGNGYVTYMQRAKASGFILVWGPLALTGIINVCCIIRVDSIDILEEISRTIFFWLICSLGSENEGKLHLATATIIRPWPQHSRLPARGGGRSAPSTTRLNISHVVIQHRTPTHFDPRNSPPKHHIFQISPIRPLWCGRRKTR